MSNSSRRRVRQPSRRGVVNCQAAPVRRAAPVDVKPWHESLGSSEMWLMAAALVAAFVWSYWPALTEMVTAWETEPDYSHGYLVIPVALYMLWDRKSTRPSFSSRPAWFGLLLIAMAVSLRLAGAAWYIEAVQAWSMLIWLTGFCWLLGGWTLTRWSLPAIGFLAFMIPLPFRGEHLLSYPLQSVASRVSCWMLQFAGQPAIREGNVLRINDLDLAVVEACSGLRIFVSIFALAFAVSVLAHKPWWSKLALWLSVLPVAVMVNAGRIALTGLLHLHVSGEAAHKFSHDLAGWLMIPAAGLLMLLVVWYMDRLIVVLQTVKKRELFLPERTAEPVQA